MEDSVAGSLASLRDLQRDLSSLSATTLRNVERLWAELQAQVADFHALLDKKGRSDQSRKTLSEIKESIKFGDNEYGISEDFKQQSVQLADALDLDEMHAARLLFDGFNQSSSLDRSPLAAAVYLFHERRQYLLECLRLTFEKAYTDGDESDLPEEFIAQFQSLAVAIINASSTNGAVRASAFWDKCTQAMLSLERSMHEIAERFQSASVTGAASSRDFVEIMTFQSDSLRRQHESLGAILFWICRGNWTSPDDLRSLIKRVRTIDRYDSTLLHYLPSLFQLVHSIAPSESHCTAADAKSIHQVICSKSDSDAWVLRNFQAATIIYWLAEYSARFGDGPGTSSDQDTSLDARNSLFTEALKDGAFHFLLGVAGDARQSEWYDPARQGMTQYLLADAPTLNMDTSHGEEFMRSLVLHGLQGFVEAYIAHMPDSLRQLKYDEDEQRRNVQSVSQLRSVEFDLHLERFLLTIAFSYESDPAHAEHFWEDTDSNLYGFLQWTSQRQSTPRAAVFCEMLCALSNGETCANHAHQFLLDEAAMASAKLRRSSPLSWNHILRELTLFASTFASRVTAPPSQSTGRSTYGDSIEEPESELMLECYLRLIGHMCQESSDARAWLLSNPAFNVVEFLIQLSRSGLASRTRACAVSAMAALLNKKDDTTNKTFWTEIDLWIHGQPKITPGQPQQLQYGRKPPAVPAQEGAEVFIRNASGGFEEPNSVVQLFFALVAEIERDGLSDVRLPFPEDLGSKYRMNGIDVYVDFVLDIAFARKTMEVSDPVQLRILRLNCLSFVSLCLGSFQDDLIEYIVRTGHTPDAVLAVSSLETYTQIHPFARVMEWMFNESVVQALFATAIQDFNEVNEHAEQSPLVLSVLKSLEVITTVLEKQATYLDFVRDRVKSRGKSQRPPVPSSALGSFDDAILNHLDLVRVLGVYSGSGHTDLAAASLRLLQRLSQSRKLATPVAGLAGRQSDKSRLISALESGGESSNISRSLAAIMQYDQREVEGGSGSPGIVIKTHILDFVSGSLDTVVNRPTIAHLLLGFGCHSHSLYIDNNDQFATEASLFGSLASFIKSSPDGSPETYDSWLLRIKDGAVQILRRLWTSPVSSSLTFDALRRMDFLLNMAAQQSVIAPDSLWDGISTADQSFYVQPSAQGLAAFLRSRAAFLEYAAAELKWSSEHESNMLRNRLQSSLFGTTTFLDGTQYLNPTIFGYLDLLEIETGEPLALPESAAFPEELFVFCTQPDGDDSIWNVPLVRQRINLQVSKLRKDESKIDEAQMDADVQNILETMVAHNQRLEVFRARLEALRAWLEVAAAMLECCDLDAMSKTAFVLQLLQQMLPRLERAYAKDKTAAALFAQFGLLLLKHADFTALQLEAAQSNHTANDRMFQLFRVAAVGLQSPDVSAALRQTCAHICHRYIRQICEYDMPYAGPIMRCIRSLGDNLMRALCDDAYGGEGPTTVSALLCLEAIVMASNRDGDPTYVLTSLSRVNFVQAMVESLGDIARDIASSGSQALAEVLESHRLSLQLILRIAESRAGAKLVLSAGFFGATRSSGIFDIDPDIGPDMDNNEAMRRYLELALGFSRVMGALVVSLGAQSQLMISQARRFLQEHRTTISSILKISIGVGRAGQANQAILEELVDNVTVLMAATQFLEGEEQMTGQPNTPRVFT